MLLIILLSHFYFSFAVLVFLLQHIHLYDYCVSLLTWYAVSMLRIHKTSLHHFLTETEIKLGVVSYHNVTAHHIHTGVTSPQKNKLLLPLLNNWLNPQQIYLYETFKIILPFYFHWYLIIYLCVFVFTFDIKLSVQVYCSFIFPFKIPSFLLSSPLKKQNKKKPTKLLSITQIICLVVPTLYWSFSVLTLTELFKSN